MKKSVLIISLFVAGVTCSFAQTKKTTTKKTTTTKTTTKTTTTTKPSVVGSITQTLTGGNTLSSLSDGDVASGLKEALKVGANNASSQLSAVDGFNKNPLVRIPFPSEVQQVAEKLRSLGMGAKVDEFETQLNRSAEKASKDAAPIFINAITGMTLTDGKNILTGGNNAATTYLSNTTRTQLFDTFSPTIKNALNEMNAANLWTEIMTTYNKIPFVTKVETDLTKYTTNKALDGLFKIVGDEELKIRQNPAAQGSALLQKVFGAK